MMKLILKRADINDAELIWKMQKEAFVELFDKYQDVDTNPANEPIEKTLSRLKEDSTCFYLILQNDEIVGAIRVIDKKDNVSKKKISPIFVLPQYRNKGIAQMAISEAEAIHGASGWELATIMQEEGNCYLYEKMGYRTDGKTQIVNEKLTLLFYKK